MLHKVYFVSSVRDITRIDWKTEYCGGRDVADIPVSTHHQTEYCGGRDVADIPVRTHTWYAVSITISTSIHLMPNPLTVFSLLSSPISMQNRLDLKWSISYGVSVSGPTSSHLVVVP